MIQYFLEVTISWTLFYSVYLLFLRKETFFNVNRWYLLHTIWIGALLPLLRKLPFSIESTEPIILEPVTFINYGTQRIAESMTAPVEAHTLDYNFIIWVVYCLGVVFFGIKICFGLKRILSMYRKGEKRNLGNIKLIVSQDFHLPFSFLDRVFIHESFLDNPFIKEILDHESTHVKGHHTYDVLFIELLSIIFWWNPMIYLYRRSLRQVHEYVADAYASAQSQIKEYGHILLGRSSSGIELALTHQFFNAHLKKRITMLYKKKSAKYQLGRYLLVIPLLMFLSVLYSFQYEMETPEVVSNDPIEVLGSKRTTTNFEPVSDIEENKPGSKISPSRSVEVKEEAKSKTPPIQNDNIGADYKRPKCVPIKDTDIYFLSTKKAVLRSCDTTGSNDDNWDCSREQLNKMVMQKVEYTEEAIQNGFQGMCVWNIIVGKDGTPLSHKLTQSIKKETYGMAEHGTTVLAEVLKNVEFIPAECDGEKVKSRIPLTLYFKLDDEQLTKVLPKTSENTEAVNQHIYIGSMSHQGTLSYFVESNLNTPTNVKAFDPNGKEIYNKDLPYYHIRYHDGVKVENPTNGTYTVVMTQDNREVKATIPVTIF